MRAAEALLAPADALRARLYRLAAPWAAPLFADRARRVAWLGAGCVAWAFLLTLTVPLWSLVLGPVLLGVPHLVSDVRYLVVRPGLHRRLGWMLCAGAPLLAVGLGAGPEVGLLALVPAVLGAGGSWWRKGLALAAWAALTVLAMRSGTGFQRVFLHAHNALAVALWWCWRPREARAWGTPLLVLGGTGALLLGAAEPIMDAVGAWTAPGTGASFAEFVEALAPVDEPVLALRLVLTFAFLQSVHYGVWLRLIPEDDRTRAAPRPWRATWRALVDDFGVPALAGFALVALGVVAWGVVDLAGARSGYLRLATFHGYLELAVAARWLAEGRRS
ncbi:hypothetical protein P2318_30910 [Myxococcaceae bacterium GXIMD 01537]